MTAFLARTFSDYFPAFCVGVACLLVLLIACSCLSTRK